MQNKELRETDVGQKRCRRMPEDVQRLEREERHNIGRRDVEKRQRRCRRKTGVMQKKAEKLYKRDTEQREKRCRRAGDEIQKRCRMTEQMQKGSRDVEKRQRR